MSKNSSQKKDMDILPFFMFGSKNPIYLESKIAQQVFIYGEYLKRKFWLDCNFERESGQYKKQNNRYIPLAFIDYNDLLMRFEQILDLHIDSGAVFLDNSPIYKRAFQKCQNIYGIIRILLKYDYFCVRRKLLSSGTQKQTSKLLRKKRKNYDDKSFEFILSIYSYERMIWTMSDFVRMNLAKAETDFGVVAQMFYYSFGMNNNSGAYHLYAEIIKKYHLYLTALLNLVSPEAIINDDYTKFILPRFINLPKLSLDNHKFKDLVEIDYNPLKKKLSISLGISNKRSIEEFGEFVKRLMIYYSYLSNEDDKSDMDSENYKYICAFLDSANPHNYTDKLDDRIDGLYLWDKLHREHSGRSASNEIEIFLKKMKGLQPTSSLKRKYQRILQCTTQTIEKGEVLPIAK